MSLKKINSVKTKILLVVLIITIILGGMLVGMMTGYFLNTSKLQKRTLEMNLSTEIKNINAEIQVLEKGSLALANTGNQYYIYRNEGTLNGEDITLSFFDSFDNAVGGGIWFEKNAVDEGQERVAFYAMKNSQGDYVIDKGFLTDEYDYHTQSWYSTIKNGLLSANDRNAVIWTKPYVDAAGTNELMTTLGAGIYDEQGKLVGISTLDWLLTDIVSRLNSNDLRPTAKSLVTLADLSNDIVISCTLDGKYAGSTTDDLAFLKAFSAASSKEGELTENTQRLSINGQKAKYLTYSEVLANDMSIVACIPTNEFYQNMVVKIVLISLSFAFVIGIAVTAVLKIIKNSLTDPIHLLTKGALELGSGNFDHKIDIKSQDELSVLADGFNKMTDDLKSYMTKLKEETSKSMAISAELGVATDIQASMLPAIFPAFPSRYEIDLFAKMQPAKEVGGDFYDFFLIDDDHLAFTIADVSGKGVPAALFMVITKTLIKTQSLSGKSPAKVLEAVNNQLCENNNANMFVTCLLGVLEVSTGKLTYSNAGHNPAAIRRKGGAFEYLNAPVGFVLAGMDGMTYEDNELTLVKGDNLVLYTDGVTEALNNQLELYGEDRLLRVLQSHTDNDAEDILQAVYKDIETFAEGAMQADDITMLVLNYQGVPTLSTLEIDATIDNMPAALQFIDDELTKNNVSEMQKMQMAIVAEEIYANVAHYAYPDKTGKVKINIHVGKDIIMEFIDSGIEYNPLSHQTPNLLSSAEERDIGGLGIVMVKAMTDNLYYRYANKQNILSLVKAVGDIEEQTE